MYNKTDLIDYIIKIKRKAILRFFYSIILKIQILNFYESKLGAYVSNLKIEITM